MTELSNLVAESVERLRRDKPLVQCLTNIVVANFTANVLLSAGAVPAMVDNPEESEDSPPLPTVYSSTPELLPGDR